jgi:hypothetical protein
MKGQADRLPVTAYCEMPAAALCAGRLPVPQLPPRRLATPHEIRKELGV